ncbi:hypothetical protein EMIT0P218_10246 [Pseudomonas sp. IT-P218]
MESYKLQAPGRKLKATRSAFNLTLAAWSLQLPFRYTVVFRGPLTGPDTVCITRSFS